MAVSGWIFMIVGGYACSKRTVPDAIVGAAFVIAGAIFVAAATTAGAR